MMDPDPHRETPLGRVLVDAGNKVARSFDAALARAGGSRSTWQILLALKQRPKANQRQIAADVGIQEATLTHHLAGMEASRLIARRRDPGNRRVHLIQLTQRGEDAFLRLRDAAMDFDRHLHAGIPKAETDQLRATVAKLVANIAQDP